MTNITVLDALSARVSADGTVQVPRDLLVAETGSSARTVDRELKKLRDTGTISIVAGGHRGAATIYRMTRESAPQTPAESAPPLTESAPPAPKKARQESAPPVKSQVKSAPRHMCTASCGYPLDRIWIEQGIDMHPWCELGVTSHHATDRQKIAAIRQSIKETP